MREAQRPDVKRIVELLLQDEHGADRENRDHLAPYLAAFEEVDRSPDQELVVAELDGRVVGTLQLSFLRGLTYQGGLRAQVEAVRVAEGLRGQGIGHQMMDWTIERARARGCRLVQLTSNRQRTRAHAFYRTLGFQDTNVGMKLLLEQPAGTASRADANP